MSETYDFFGQVAIVTGAARGLGRAYALSLIKARASVVVADILDGSDTGRAITEQGARPSSLKRTWPAKKA